MRSDWTVPDCAHPQANDLMLATDEIVRSIDALRFAPFKPKALRDIMENVQHHVDQLSRDALTNLDAWVVKLNERVEGILAGRLRVAIRSWTTAFSNDFTGGAKTAANTVANGGGDTTSAAPGSADASGLGDQLDVSLDNASVGRRTHDATQSPMHIQ